MPKPHNGARAKAGAFREHDDLTVIEGIGPARSEWLRASLGVKSYADLAALSPDEVTAALKAARQVASRGAAAAWIARADELANAPANSEWFPLASFVVEFQAHERAGALRTVVHHVEADENETWPAIETASAAEWMRERAPKPPAKVRQEKTAVVTASAPAHVTIGPIRLRREGAAYAAAPAERPGARAFARWLPGDEPFSLEVPLDVPSAGAAAEGGYRVRLYAEDLATAAMIHLGDAAPDIVEGTARPSHAAIVRNCRLREGVYRLSVLAFEGHRLSRTAAETPLLRVG